MNLALYDSENFQIKNLECLGEMNHFLLSIYNQQQDVYQTLRIQSNQLFSINKSYTKIYGFQNLYDEKNSHINFSREEIYVSGVT